MKFAKHKATTLVEIILYFVLLAVFLFVAMTFSIQVLNVTSLSANTNDLQTNVDLISQQLSYAIQTASAVDNAGSKFDDAAGVLSLTMRDAGVSPTIFSLTNYDLYLTAGTANAIRLNSDTVSVDSINFHKIEYSKSPDQIVIDAVFTPKGNDISNLTKTINFHLSISLRE